jgi:hypothetical protein
MNSPYRTDNLDRGTYFAIKNAVVPQETWAMTMDYYFSIPYEKVFNVLGIENLSQLEPNKNVLFGRDLTEKEKLWIGLGIAGVVFLAYNRS